MKSTDFLDNLGHQLRSQDNCYTSFPIYEVQEHRLIAGIDPDYTEKIGWFHSDSGSLADDEEAALLEAGYDETGEVPQDWHRTGYDHRWEQIATFMTRDAAEDFIKRQKHNHSELRVYVNSAYRNPEMRELRRLLAGPVQDCIAALREVTAELVQLHAHHYSNCEGGCPADTYVRKAQAAMNALNEFQDPYR